MNATRGNAGDVAVIGIALRFPGADTPETFWQNLRNGVESITFFSEEELDRPLPTPDILDDPRFVRARPILDHADRFDAPFFGITPREAETMDPQYRIFLECAWESLEDAGYDPGGCDGRVGVYGGMGRGTYLQRFLAADPELAERIDDLNIRIGNEKDYLATRVSYTLDLKGPSVSVQTGCSTSMVAVALACRGLADGDCDLALAGGVSLVLPQKAGYLYAEGGILSRDGHCRAFDAEATGTLFGSGAGLVVLKRLGEAVADGDHIRAVIRGVAMNNDGFRKDGYSAPGLEGQTGVIADALRCAGVDAGTIGYIEAHGTGTRRGDPVEIEALTRAYREHTGATNYCALGTVKTNIGHPGMASGIAGLIKTVLTLEHREIPPILHFTRPNPDIDFDGSPFFVNTSLHTWEAGETPRRAGVNSYGIGGTNVHAVLEEAPGVVAPLLPAGGRLHLLPISAVTPSALERATRNLRDYLQRHPDLDPGDVAFTLQQGRKAFKHRRVVVCDGLESAVEELSEGDARGGLTGAAEQTAPEVAFMFPGQGAQHPGMAAGLYAACPDFREDIDRGVAILESDSGLRLRDVLFPDEEAAPEARRLLTDTTFAQPALFVVEYALAQWWMRRGVMPAAMIGHSVGEFAAACLAGVFSMEDALRLVAFRGRRVGALPAGAMLAALCSEETLLPLLGERLYLAAVNGPRLCVASGREEDIASLERDLAGRDIACRRLDTSHAFHSSAVDPVVDEFTAMVADATLCPPALPLISTVTGTWLTAAEAVDPSYWGRHMRETVRFAAGLEELAGKARILVEAGPGATLTALARRRKRNAPAPPAFSTLPPVEGKGCDVSCAWQALGRLWVAGVAVNWQALHAGENPRRVPLPTYPFERRRYWIDLPEGAAPGRRLDLPQGKRPDVADWFYVPSWKRSFPPRGPREGAAGSRWLIFEDASGLGARIADRLREEGGDVITVVPGAGFARDGNDHLAIDPYAAGDYDRLVRDLSSPHGVPLRILHLWGVDDAAEEQREYYSLLHLGGALVRGGAEEPVDVCFVARTTQAVVSDDVLAPGKVSALGLCRVLPQESDLLSCRSVDVVLPDAGSAPVVDELAGRILAEVLSGGAERVVAYRGTQRWVQSTEPVRLDAVPGVPALLRRQGTYLLTGGLGGVGFLLARYLARELQARLVLVGRTALPDREAWDAMSADPDDPVARRIARVVELESLGADVLVAAADVACMDAMQRVLQAADERFGGVHGVVHAAGILGAEAFRAVDRLSPSDCASQFRPKVQGLQVLETLLRDRDLDFCLLTSSLSSVLGGIGYGAYAAANLYMDAFAWERNRSSAFPWIAVNWDRWVIARKTGPGAGDSPDQAEVPISGRWDSVGMTPDEGLETFERILDVDAPGQVIVSTGDLEARWDHWVRLRREAGRPSTSTRHPRGEMAQAYVAPRTRGERIIATIWEDLFGFDQVGADDDFFELGGHSLMGVQFLNRLRKDHGVELPLRSLFEHRTVAALAKHQEEKGGSDRPGESESLVESLGEASPGERLALVRAHIRMMIARGMGMPAEELPEDEDLTSRGLKMIIPDLVVGARNAFSFTLRAGDIVKRPSVIELAAFVTGEMERSLQGRDVATEALPLPPRLAALFAPARERSRPMVFVLSSPRSGSTLLRIMLSCHSRLFCPGELGLLDATTLADWQHHPRSPNRRRGLAGAFAELTDCGTGECAQAVDTLIGESVSTPAIYRALQRGAHPRLLVDKTPDYAMDRDAIHRAETLFEEARYILLVRHPLAVIESFVRSGLEDRFPGSENDPYTVAEDCWATSNDNLLQFMQEHTGRRVLRVHYEEMVTDTARTLQAICRFLDVPFEDTVLSPYQYGRMLEAPGDVNTGRRGRIDPGLANAWRTVELPRPLRGLCRRVAAAWGYDVGEVGA